VRVVLWCRAKEQQQVPATAGKLSTVVAAANFAQDESFMGK
jgi:hypothetical protein